ncbi:MAG: DUF4962 domain-containing protein [Anaerolineales bacterium]|nr:DUF4962 domain-containing protein [Anaerolineales bacterium]
MKQLIRFLILIGLITGGASSHQFATQGAAVMDHPYLFFDSGDLPNLITDANDPYHERYAIFQSIKGQVDAEGGSVAPTKGLPSYALVYQITGETAYAEAVRQGMLDLAGQTDWEIGERDREMAEKLTYYALAFDLTHDYLKTKSDFNTIRDKLALETFKMYEAASSDYNRDWANWWRTAYSQNHFHRNVGSMVLGALALKYEGDQLTDFNQNDVDAWITFSREVMAKNQAALDGIIDGSWFEGNMYEETTIGIDLPHPLYALKRVEGLDLIARSPWLQNVPKFWIYNMVPDEQARSRLTQYGDGGSSWWRQNGFLATLRLLAREYRDPYAQWAADRIVVTNGRQPYFAGMSYALAIVYEFFYFDESVASASPANAWPESWLAEDLGVAFMHSSWGKGGMHAALKTGAYGGRALFELTKSNYIWDGDKWKKANYPVGGSQGAYPQDMSLVTSHAHPDNNGIYIYANGVYLAPEAAGSGNKGSDGKQKDPWSRLTSSHNTIAVDGRGQVGEVDVHPSHGYDRVDFFESDGQISIFAPTANYDFALGDATRSYPRSLGLTEFQRHFLFLKPDYFVMFDTLDATSPKTYDWFLHIPDEVSFEGRWVKGRADDGNLLGVYVVSPQNYTMETGVRANKTAFRFVDPDEELHYFKLGVSGSREMRFITVLLPTTESEWADRPKVEKIDETSQYAGVQVTHSDGAVDVLLSGYHVAGMTTIGSFRMDGLVAAVRRTASGDLDSIYLVKGSRLVESGTTILSMDAAAHSFDASYSSSAVDVTGDGINGFRLYAPSAQSLTINGQPVSFTRDGDFIIYGSLSPTFADVPFDHPYHDEIEALYRAGYTAGCNIDPLMYCPERTMNRAESAVFVERGIHGADVLPIEPTVQIFADVPLGEWFTKWTTALWNDGYTAGCGIDPLMYCPLQGHTRAEGCVFYLRMLNGADYVPPAPSGIFTDVPVDTWYADWVEAAYNAGILPACSTDPLRACPADPLNRGLAAYMMVQANGLPTEQ